MKMGTLSLAAAALFALGGCNGDDTDTDDTDTDDVSSTAPTIEALPSHGARGVLVGDPIILTFSEPMSPESVEAAWTSTSLPADQLVFTWNDAGTILFVDASSVLVYPFGDETVDRMGFGYTIDASAHDAEGDTLGAPFSVEFDTARDVQMTLTPTLTVGEGTGSFDGSGSTTVLRVGDTTSNASWRAFVTFDLSHVPADVVVWQTATLRANQESIYGTPYADLGAVTLGRLPGFVAIDSTSYVAVRTHQVELSDSVAAGAVAGDRSVDVTAAVQADHEIDAASATFRFEFEGAHDGGADEDAAIFRGAQLDLRLLVE